MNLFLPNLTGLKRCSFFLTSRLIILTLALACLLALGMAAPARADVSVLVLYDSAGTEGWMGQLYVQQLANLLSHFEIEIACQPVEEYTAGEINNYQAAVYLGALYDNPLPAAFRDDFLNANIPFGWLGYNLWQVAWTPDRTADNPAFVQKFGVKFVRLDSSAYTQVLYKNVTLTRRSQSQPLGKLQIVDPLKVAQLATCQTADLSKEAPYITRAANLWYVADNPMAYVSMTDRYLAFADVLHDFLNLNHPESHRAMIRIEDVHPMANPANLRAIADYLSSQQVPFLVCVIPEYRDPLGKFNHGVPLTVTLAEAPEVVSALRYMVSRGGQIVMHGFTHQYDVVQNPYSGVTAEDYEFYRIILDGQGKQVLVGPVPGDSPAWARERLVEGKSRLTNLGFRPVAWNTPHYLASVTDYLQFAQLFSLSLDRGAYFATDSLGQVNCLDQIAPYVFHHDVYGIKRLPETIGYIDPSGGSPSLPADLLHRAELNKVVRDGWASCYFHWYLDLSYLQELVTGLKNQGYQFYRVGPWTVAPILQLLLLDDTAG